LTSELILGAGVLLTAGSLALLPPPGETSGLPLDLVQPAGANGNVRLHLILDRVRVGDLQAEIRADAPTGRRRGRQRARLRGRELAPLEAAVQCAPPPTRVSAPGQPAAGQTVSSAPFS